VYADAVAGAGQNRKRHLGTATLSNYAVQQLAPSWFDPAQGRLPARPTSVSSSAAFLSSPEVALECATLQLDVSWPALTLAPGSRLA
jgi:hypothetical protein